MSLAPGTSDSTTTCTNCWAHPISLNYDSPEWGGLCLYCKYIVNNHRGVVNNPPSHTMFASYFLYRVVPNTFYLFVS